MIDGMSRSNFQTDAWMEDLFKGRVNPPKSRPPDYDTAIAQVMKDLKHVPKVKAISLTMFTITRTPLSGWATLMGQRNWHPGNHRRDKILANGARHGYAQATDKLNYMRKHCTPDPGFARTQMSEFSLPTVRCMHGRAMHNILIESVCAYPLVPEFT